MEIRIYNGKSLPTQWVPILAKLTIGPKGSMGDALVYRREDNPTIIVARVGTDIVGWLMASNDTLTWQNTRNYVAVFVHPNHRRRGVGTALLRTRLHMDDVLLDYFVVDVIGCTFFRKFRNRVRKGRL